MYFYQSNREVCQYISEHELWVLGRITGIHNKTTHKNEKMLEPLWRKYDKNIEGISIFYSKMDAAFYSTYLAQRFNEKWDVYPLDDFNIKEMMMNNQQVKKPTIIICYYMPDCGLIKSMKLLVQIII